jgi:hypothetical protein
MLARTHGIELAKSAKRIAIYTFSVCLSNCAYGYFIDFKAFCGNKGAIAFLALKIKSATARKKAASGVNGDVKLLCSLKTVCLFMPKHPHRGAERRHGHLENLQEIQQSRF